MRRDRRGFSAIVTAMVLIPLIIASVVWVGYLVALSASHQSGALRRAQEEAMMAKELLRIVIWANSTITTTTLPNGTVTPTIIYRTWITIISNWAGETEIDYLIVVDRLGNIVLEKPYTLILGAGSEVTLKPSDLDPSLSRYDNDYWRMKLDIRYIQVHTVYGNNFLSVFGDPSGVYLTIVAPTSLTTLWTPVTLTVITGSQVTETITLTNTATITSTNTITSTQWFTTTTTTYWKTITRRTTATTTTTTPTTLTRTQTHTSTLWTDATRTITRTSWSHITTTTTTTTTQTVMMVIEYIVSKVVTSQTTGKCLVRVVSKYSYEREDIDGPCSASAAAALAALGNMLGPPDGRVGGADASAYSARYSEESCLCEALAAASVKWDFGGGKVTGSKAYFWAKGYDVMACAKKGGDAGASIKWWVEPSGTVLMNAAVRKRTSSTEYVCTEKTKGPFKISINPGGGIKAVIAYAQATADAMGRVGAVGSAFGGGRGDAFCIDPTVVRRTYFTTIITTYTWW